MSDLVRVEIVTLAAVLMQMVGLLLLARWPLATTWSAEAWLRKLLCLQPAASDLPEADVVLMHKLVIQADEAMYLHTTNRFRDAVAVLIFLRRTGRLLKWGMNRGSGRTARELERLIPEKARVSRHLPLAKARGLQLASNDKAAAYGLMTEGPAETSPAACAASAAYVNHFTPATIPAGNA